MTSLPHGLSIDIRDNVVTLEGELDMDGVGGLGRSLGDLIDTGSGEVVIDLSALTFIDSSGLGALVDTQKRLLERGRRLDLRAPSRFVIKVLEITDLVNFFNVTS